jgi:ribosomal-protein-alanine N-acetyltransferase
MEMMPQPHTESATTPPLGRASLLPTFGLAPAASEGPAFSRDWRRGLTTLVMPQCTLRELTLEDAPSLYAHLTAQEVARYISPPPTSVEGFETFIGWAHRQRRLGRYACFGIVPRGETAAVGFFQVCVAEDGRTAEWGFVLGSTYWGTGIFLAGAKRVLDFVFVRLRLLRLDARAMPQNGRGNGALRKVGAVRAGLLRGSFERNGERLDQALWVITQADWWARFDVKTSGVH